MIELLGGPQATGSETAKVRLGGCLFSSAYTGRFGEPVGIETRPMLNVQLSPKGLADRYSSEAFWTSDSWPIGGRCSLAVRYSSGRVLKKTEALRFGWMIRRQAARDLRRSLRVRFQPDPIIYHLAESLLPYQPRSSSVQNNEHC